MIVWIVLVGVVVIHANSFDLPKEYKDKINDVLEHAKELNFNKAIGEILNENDVMQFQDHKGNLKDVSLNELQEKMKKNEKLQARLSTEGQAEEGTIAFENVEKKDPNLAFYIRIAKYGLRVLQGAGHAKGKKLLGFTDAMDKIPETRKDQHTMELVLRAGEHESKEEELYYVEFHGDQALYQGGIAVVKARKVDAKGNTIQDIHVRKPPLPRWKNPAVLVLGAGAFLILFGMYLLCCLPSPKDDVAKTKGRTAGKEDVKAKKTKKGKSTAKKETKKTQ